MQRHHRLPITAVPDAQRHLANIDAIQPEAIEHQPHLPTRSATNQAAVEGSVDP